MTTKESHGTASLSADCSTLTIKTMVKRGKKEVPLIVTYEVFDICPDKKVANPAYRLVKESGEFYDVAMMRYGPTCTCPHATYRGSNSRVPCKHIRACQAVQLLPKGRNQ